MAEPALTRRQIESIQLEKLRGLIAPVAASNGFYRQKWKSFPAGFLPASLEEFGRRFPITIKSELVADQLANPPFGTNLTRPVSHYTRFHQTSGTTGTPLRWVDTPESWSSMVESWVRIFAAAAVAGGDRVYFAFSFGPFIGFWLAFDAAQKIGALCLPGGGLGSAGRLKAILENQATVLCCTPTYALRLAEVAREENIDLGGARVRTIIVAGEPGGSIPAIRARIEAAWPGARVFDHHGMTEVGPVTYECPKTPGLLHVIESAYLAEILDSKTMLPTSAGEAGELVLTTLGRVDSPLIRYRTGDLVRSRAADSLCACGRAETALEGGILGRADDMIIVRGINIFPGALDEVIGRFPGIVEFQVRVARRQVMTELEVLIEAEGDTGRSVADLVQSLESSLHAAFNLRIPVRVAPTGTLPRFEMKARRWVFDGPPGARP